MLLKRPAQRLELSRPPEAPLLEPAAAEARRATATH